ncbi:hypothetical protein BLS_003384 [Venturia inaequalis]|uniref:Uncharacterized protein n=1 Tax=Venturia inaequalis TaxID=5025 RepID=A0A8H3URG8_VENIN|nr:hypothetical protein EG328_008900 [Venturia inaequalis]KAE9973908.1 hypothetical protein BLS_003384 [Venturia inaequalis]
MDPLSGHIVTLVLLLLALLLTDPFSFTLAAPSSWFLICGILALAYLLCLEQNRLRKETITLEAADCSGYEPQPPLESQAQRSKPQRQHDDLEIWIETVQRQRNTILGLHDQTLKEKKRSEHLDLRLKEEQKKSAAQHSIATKLPNASDAQKVLDLRQTIADLTQKFRNLESTFGDRLEESRKLSRPKFEEEVKKNWILLSRWDEWQAWKEVKVWCYNHGLMVVEAGNSSFDDSVSRECWPSYIGGQYSGQFGSSLQRPSVEGNIFSPAGTVFGTQGHPAQQPGGNGGSGSSGQPPSPLPPWSGQVPEAGYATNIPPSSPSHTGNGTPGQTPESGGSNTDFPKTGESDPKSGMSGQPRVDDSSRTNAPGQDPSGDSLNSGTTSPTSGTTSPPTSRTGSPGLPTTQTTVAATTTLTDPYPVSIKSSHSPKKLIILNIERATGTLSDLDELWRDKCKVSGQPSDGSFEWYWVDEESQERTEVKDKCCLLAEHEDVPEESRRDGVTLSVEDLD